jgi:acetyl/propionyl-CoA carboxylase alpha subunit
MIIKKVNINGEELEYEVLKESRDSIEFKLNGTNYQFDYQSKKQSEIVFRDPKNTKHSISYSLDSNEMHCVVNSKDAHLDFLKSLKKKKSAGEEHEMISPMPGKILKVMVKAGDEVLKNQALVVMEAMKMEHTIKASKDGVIKNVKFSENDQVTGGIVLVEFEESNV